MRSGLYLLYLFQFFLTAATANGIRLNLQTSWSDLAMAIPAASIFSIIDFIPQLLFSQASSF
jgi:hypothetical protein